MAAKSKCNKEFTHGKKKCCSVYDKSCGAGEADKGHKISSCPPTPFEYFFFFPSSHLARAAEEGSNSQQAVFY